MDIDWWCKGRTHGEFQQHCRGTIAIEVPASRKKEDTTNALVVCCSKVYSSQRDISTYGLQKFDLNLFECRCKLNAAAVPTDTVNDIAGDVNGNSFFNANPKTQF